MERSSGETAELKVYSFSTFFFPKLCGGVQVGGHAAVKRWTKAVDLFLYDLILVPLHLGVHWALAVSPTTVAKPLVLFAQNFQYLSLNINFLFNSLTGDWPEFQDSQIIRLNGPETWRHLWSSPVSVPLFTRSHVIYFFSSNKYVFLFMLMYLWFMYRRYLKDEHKAKKGTELDGTKWTIGSLRASVSQVHERAKLPFPSVLPHFLFNINSLCAVAFSVGNSTAEKWQRLWRFHL